MAQSMKMAIFKSVTKAALSSAMIFVSIVRLGMLAYPQAPVVTAGSDAVAVPLVQSQLVNTKVKRRIILGQNSIANLGKAK